MKRKPKKLTYAKVKKDLDSIFSRWFKASKADRNGYLTCYTCGKIAHITAKMGNGVPVMQTGHYNRAPHLLSRWMPENCRVQCWHCNCGLDGNYDIYTLRLIDEIGREEVDRLVSLRHKSPKIPTWQLEERIAHYQKLLTQLNGPTDSE